MNPKKQSVLLPPMWQAEADTKLTLSASPVTAVGQSKLTMANLDQNTTRLKSALRADETQHTWGLVLTPWTSPTPWT